MTERWVLNRVMLIPKGTISAKAWPGSYREWPVKIRHQAFGNNDEADGRDSDERSNEPVYNISDIDRFGNEPRVAPPFAWFWSKTGCCTPANGIVDREYYENGKQYGNQKADHDITYQPPTLDTTSARNLNSGDHAGKLLCNSAASIQAVFFSHMAGLYMKIDLSGSGLLLINHARWYRFQFRNVWWPFPSLRTPPTWYRAETQGSPHTVDIFFGILPFGNACTCMFSL